jgi:hypothetical protein
MDATKQSLGDEGGTVMVRGQWAPHDRHGTTTSLPLIHFFFSRSDRQSRLPSDLLSVTRVEAPPPSTRLEGDLVTAARRHGGGQRPHRHARGPHGKYIISLLPYGPRSKADPLTMDLCVCSSPAWASRRSSSPSPMSPWSRRSTSASARHPRRTASSSSTWPCPCSRSDAPSPPTPPS